MGEPRSTKTDPRFTSDDRLSNLVKEGGRQMPYKRVDTSPDPGLMGRGISMCGPGTDYSLVDPPEGAEPSKRGLLRSFLRWLFNEPWLMVIVLATFLFWVFVAFYMSGGLQARPPVVVQQAMDVACQNAFTDPGVAGCESRLIDTKVVGDGVVYTYLGDVTWRDDSHSFVPISIRVDEAQQIVETS